MIILDHLKFPMVKVECLRAYMGLLPITKVQFEYFLCHRSDPAFNESWYTTILNQPHGKRVAAGQIAADNYWQAFITGITPGEAQKFTDWCRGEDEDEYMIPSSAEWTDAFEELRQKNAIPIAAFDEYPDINPRARRIIEKLERVQRGRSSSSQRANPFSRTGGPSPSNTQTVESLADQMLLRNGILEWVRHGEGWAGLGSPLSQLVGGVLPRDNGAPNPRTPRDVNVRSALYGFRLVRHF